jgi:hypothetical protein
MTPFEIASLALAYKMFWIYVIQCVLIGVSICASLWIAIYPNSRYAMKRRAKSRAKRFLSKAFGGWVDSLHQDIKIEFDTPYLTDEDKLVYENLSNCKWTGNHSWKAGNPFAGHLAGFSFSMSQHFYDIKMKARKSTKEVGDKMCKKMAKNLNSK